MILSHALGTLGLDDPKADIPFLSHAHTDHTRGFYRKEKVVASEPTLALAGLSAKPFLPRGLKLLDAGHILGARQLLFECDGERVLYTGDFSIKENIFSFKAEFAECDRLIFDATYGHPSFSFPDPFEVYDEILKWVKEGGNRIIGCYELGKAQEIIKILNEAGITPLVTEKAFRYSSVYARFFPLDFLLLGSEEGEEVMRDDFVALVPMRCANKRLASALSLAYNRKTECAVVTGWAQHRRFNAHRAFPLSNHCDFNDLLSFIEYSGAKRLEYFCGNGEAVVNHFKFFGK